VALKSPIRAFGTTWHETSAEAELHTITRAALRLVRKDDDNSEEANVSAVFARYGNSCVNPGGEDA
jgi:hypothetical protein